MAVKEQTHALYTAIRVFTAPLETSELNAPREPQFLRALLAPGPVLILLVQFVFLGFLHLQMSAFQPVRSWYSQNS